MAYATYLTMQADKPFLEPQETTLEQEHYGLITLLAHDASMIFSTRRLNTGLASEVSGVLRITRGGDDIHNEHTEDTRDRDLLFRLRDWNAWVFERGH